MLSVYVYDKELTPWISNAIIATNLPIEIVEHNRYDCIITSRYYRVDPLLSHLYDVPIYEVCPDCDVQLMDTLKAIVDRFALVE